MKRTRASRGQNTVYYVDSKQCWISQGYFNGKRLTASSKKSGADALRKLKDKMKTAEQSFLEENMEGERMTVWMLLEKYIEFKKRSGLRDSTLKNYWDYSRYIEGSEIAELCIGQVSEEKLRMFYERLLTEGNRRKR